MEKEIINIAIDSFIQRLELANEYLDMSFSEKDIKKSANRMRKELETDLSGLRL